MAVTQGHGNPDWTRDETILALDLYFKTDMGRLRSADPRVQALSKLLRSLPYHSAAAKTERFRNAAGVAFKIQNLHSVATGKGLSNVSETDRAVWNEFGGRPREVERLADLIKAGIRQSEEGREAAPQDEEFYEGRLLSRLHYSRERNPKIRSKLLAARMSGGLRCDLCDISYPALPPDLAQSAFEGHHVLPLSAGSRATKLADMALLCACCHRLIHKAIAVQRRWMSVEEARNLLLLRPRA